jgi:hypothetical protein
MLCNEQRIESNELTQHKQASKTAAGWKSTIPTEPTSAGAADSYL